MPLAPGMIHTLEETATAETLASRYGNPGVEVLATPVVVAWIERAAMELVRPHLEPGQGTVGTTLDMKHQAPTPAGMRVRTTVRLKTVDGRRLVFEAEVHDEREKIAEGEHERFIIAMPRFLDRVAAKSQGR